MLVDLDYYELPQVLYSLIDKSKNDKNLMNTAIAHNLLEIETGFRNDRFECIRLADKIYKKYGWLIKNNAIDIHKECNLSGVELKNYLSWLEKQEA